jgi:hypothetical protein
MSLTSIDSPLRYVSYDILLEIFFHCLPENPLDALQPNKYLVPILFCHVCSFWRTVALSSPSLWTHLHVQLPILWDDNKEPIVRDPEALARKVEFMTWWRTNHGSLAPLLRINLHRRSWRFKEREYVSPLESKIEDFLCDYLSSAQYLDVGIFYIYLTRQNAKRGLPITSFSKLHTMVSLRNQLTDDDGLSKANDYFGGIGPSQIPPTLRRLAIENEGTRVYYSSQLDNWAILTHLSLHSLHLSLGVWFSFIRKLINLQWGDFSVATFNEATEPPEATLSFLSTLSMYCHFRSGASPLSTLFQNLKLPALRTLSLSSSAPSWRDAGALTEIHDVLKSAPAITKLFLGTYAAAARAKAGFLCFREPHSVMPTAIGDTDTFLAMDAPHLTHLQVELRCAQTVDSAVLARRFVEEFFIFNSWLGLASAMNTIRTVTVVVKNARRDTVPDFYSIMEDLLVWNIQKYVNTPTNVSFEVVSADNVTGAYFDGAAWKTWESKFETIYHL